MTQQQLDPALQARIDTMTHEAMARLIRFAPSEEPIVQDKAAWEYFMARFKSLGGWTPGLSKRIGW